MDIRAQLKAAIYGQESGSGKADTSRPNYAGAQGPMQMLPDTFAGLKANGVIPQDWSLTNKDQALEAGYRHIDSLADTYGDDPRKVAAAYYSGPKSVREDGTILDFHDPKNPAAPSTHGYVNSILRRMGLEQAADFTGSGNSPVTGAVVQPTLEDWGSIPAPGKATYKMAKPLPETRYPLNPERPAPITGDPIRDQLQAETELLQEDTAKTNASNVLTSAQHQYAWAGVGGVITRMLGTELEFPPQPGYMPREHDKDFYAGRSEADQQYLDEAVSHKDAEYRDLQIQYREDDMREATRNGTGHVIMGGLMGGLPEGFAAGFGAARIFNVARAWRQANAVRGALSVGPQTPEVIAAARATGEAASRTERFVESVAEQAVGNVGDLAIQSAFDPYVSKDDAFMALGMSVLGAGVDSIGWHPTDSAVIRQMGQNLQSDAATKIAATRAQALKTLGPDATPEALQAEVRRLEAADLKQTISSATTTVPENRRLIPEVDPIVEEERIKAEKEAEAAAKSAPEGTKSEAKPDDNEYIPLATVGPQLPDQLAGAKPRYSFGRKGFELEFESDVDKAAYIAAQPTPSKRDALYVKWVAEHTGMSEAEIRAHGQTVRERIKAEAATSTEPRIQVKTLDRTKAAVATEDMGVAHPGFPGSANEWRAEGGEARRRAMFESDPSWQKELHSISEGMTLPEAEALPAGSHVRPEAAASLAHAPAIQALHALARQYLPGARVIIGLESGIKAAGRQSSLGDTHFISLRSDLAPTQALHTAIHEFGHALFHDTAKDIPPELAHWLVGEYNTFAKELSEGRASAGFKRFREGSTHVVNSDGTLKGKVADTAYSRSFDEYAAEAFARHIQRAARAAGSEIELPKGAVSLLKAAWEKIRTLWEKAQANGWLPKDEAFDEYFSRVLNGTLKDGIPKGDVREARLEDIPEFASLNLEHEIGAGILPEGTVQQRAEKRLITSIHEKARAWATTHKVDPARLSKLLKNTVFDPASSVMLRSSNPVVRMVSAELLESGGGAGGRRSNAAMAKWLHQRQFMGNAINDVQRHYVEWRNLQGGSTWGDFRDGDMNRAFNKMVAEEIESRKAGARPAESPVQVQNAADVMEQAYERMRQAQLATKTVGWASLPETSVGYMPHRMSRDAVLNMTPAQSQALWQSLVDQFITIEGYDASFSANLAGKYIDRVKRAALGGYDAPAGIHQTGASDIVEDALTAMGLSQQEVRTMMQRYMAGGPGHTKRRLRLDLLAEQDDGNGGTFRLLDLFETDQLKLLRSQVDRVSGEVALAQHGVMGKAGLALLRRAMEFGTADGRATSAEIEAFDQVSAEFLGAPFGTAAGKWADRAMQMNSLARLGGMAFNQLGESINAIFHVGAGRTLESVLGMRRLRAEAVALSHGKAVDNPIISSIETYGGAEFGTDAYKMVFPFDEGNNELRVYGKDSVHFADRVLRGGTHLQAKLSFWRALNAAQYRGMAEQIVHKAMKFIRDGGEDVALDDMGIHAELRAKLKAELDRIAEFDGSGRLQRFDITKIEDTQAGTEFVQAVHRGVGQIIQNEHIGERGKWAHSGFLRLLTQFRTFSITSVEKQWARQVGNHGTAKAFGMMMGAMSIAAPLYIARTVVLASGKKNKDEYLAQQLTAVNIARATLNYISMSGLAGDFLDATSAVTGIGQSSGGRHGTGKSLIGDTIAPAAGLANDLYEGIQNTKNGTDPHQLLKSLPMSRLPYLVPALDGLANHLTQ